MHNDTLTARVRLPSCASPLCVAASDVQPQHMQKESAINIAINAPACQHERRITACNEYEYVGFVNNTILMMMVVLVIVMG